jgi:hypothetical protein
VTRPSADATQEYMLSAALALFCGLSFDGATTREIARLPKPRAADVAAVSEAPDTQPMPVYTIAGDRPPGRRTG